MKMKTNCLHTVLLAVIMAALLIMAGGLLNQAYADDDYYIEIRPSNDQWTSLPGDSVPVSAKVYYDFEGENLAEYMDMEFKWSLGTDDSQFAKVKIDPNDPSKATVKFKDLPEGQAEIDAVIDLKVAAYSDGRKIGSGFANLSVSSDFYRLYPDIVNEYLEIGDTDEVIANVLHYTLDHPEGVPVENVEFTWEYETADIDIKSVQKQPTGEKFEIKRITGEDAFLGLEAKWMDGEEYRYEYNSFWMKNIPTDLNDYRINLPEDIPEFQFFVDEGTKITQQHLREDTNVYLDNLLLDRNADYDLVVYRYDGWNEETGETYWVEMKPDEDLTTALKGSPLDRNGEPTEGTGYFKVTARTKAGSIYTGETEDWAEYIYMCSNKCVAGYIPDFYYNSAYTEFLDDEPYMRYSVNPGTSLEPVVKLDDKTLEEGKDYRVMYVGITVELITEEFPEKIGSYEAYVIGQGDYYGTSFSHFIKVANDNDDFTASGKTLKVKVGKKAKKTTKKKTFAKSKAFKSSGNAGKVTYKKVSGNSKITVSSAGKVTVKKGLKKGTYKVKVDVTDNETFETFASTKTVTVTVKVTK